MRIHVDNRKSLHTHFPVAQQDALGTGFKVLDSELPLGGWPTSGVLECVTRENRALAFQLLLPALATLTRTNDPRWVVLVAPPFFPSRPGLLAAGVDLSRLLIVRPDSSQGIEVIETLLASGNCSAVIAWPMVESEQLSQRFTDAADMGDSLAVLFRDTVKRKHPIMNVLRIGFHPSDDVLLLDIQQAGMRTKKMACQIPYAQLYHGSGGVRLNS